jgi:cytochrome c556
MIDWIAKKSCLAMAGAMLVGTALMPGLAAAAAPTPAELAIGYRQALYTVLDGNFEYLGGVAKGHMPFKGAEVVKRAERLAYLATMIGDAFPEVSKSGHTDAKPEIWTHRADFDKKVQALVTDTAALVTELKKDSSNSVAFKKAFGAVGQDCKSCHDDYKKE